ncbi:MAG: hypothetical protein JWM11_1090 [Planctomycetaceae bacterium]|nr:hypothetical protein [Planctomycetaceae bacterium]
MQTVLPIAIFAGIACWGVQERKTSELKWMAFAPLGVMAGILQTESQQIECDTQF